MRRAINLSQRMELIDVNILTTSMTIATIYAILFRNLIKARMHARVELVALSISLANGIVCPITYFWILEKPYHYWRDWIIAVTASLGLMMMIICQLEILRLFSVVAPFWTSSRVNRLIGIAVGLHFLSAMPCYIIPATPLLMEMNMTVFQFIDRWRRIGASAYAILIATFAFWATGYLIQKIYAHFRQNQKRQIQLRLPLIRKFSITLITILVSDLIGIGFYAMGGRFVYVAYELLHTRTILIVYVFLQLSKLTMVRDVLVSEMEIESPPLKRLADVETYNRCNAPTIPAKSQFIKTNMLNLESNV